MSRSGAPRRTGCLAWRWRVAAAALAAACSSLPADEGATDALVSDDDVTVEELDGGLVPFLPTAPLTDRAVAFYPDGLVEPVAYAPLLHRLAARGVPAVLVPTPSDLAVLDPDRGKKAVEAFPVDATLDVLAPLAVDGTPPAE